MNLYKLGDEISHHDRDIFDEPIEEKLRRPISSLRQWVKITIPTVNKCMRDFKEKLRSKQHDIRNFFKSKSTKITRANDSPRSDNHDDSTVSRISDRTLGATTRKEHYQSFRRPLPIRDKNQDTGASAAATSMTTRISLRRDGQQQRRHKRHKE